ncbi:MAG: 23S rRNA (pseudouridine(1915)-N(3))-methyltransferase RlmH [Bacteroidetes bacterium]|nr:23S rRNA (pseudouridine(1915)-N(3))-methyltransferase RlmH [Bacteroidota bacterium]MBL6964110.1 23S rRNA (pseudouridine(1915)-N(3))-methyltransferase RlmH [Bacteroidota bacterium]
MKTEFWMTGKTNHSYLKPGIELYTKRIQHYTPFASREIEIPKSKNPKEAVQTEQEQILKLIQPNDQIILLDEKGKSFTSYDFAKYLQQQFNSSPNRLIFLTGGSYGFGDDIYHRSNALISLSKFTFPHDLVRIIFLEQFYRALSIIHNHPYQH